MTSTAAAPPRPLRVVIADDSADMRLLLQVSLGRTDALEIVGLASDGEEAVRLVAEEHPDLVLLDFAMPEMDGLEAAVRIREAWPACRIIVLSGYRAELLAEDAARAGVDVFVEKAGGDANLFATIERLFPGAQVSPPASRRGAARSSLGRIVGQPTRPDPSDGDDHTDVERLLLDEVTRAQRSSAARAALVRALSHDVRNPLTIIRGFALTLVQDVVDDEEQRRALIARIATQADLALQITSELLEANALDDTALHRTSTDVAQLAAEVVSSCAPNHPITVVAATPVVADVEPLRVRYLLEALVTNAIVRNPSTTPVWVRVERDDREVVISVEDAGAPLAAADRIHAFDATLPHAGPGSGLGPALAAGFAAEHGGRAWAEDRRGGGAIFRIALPG